LTPTHTHTHTHTHRTILKKKKEILATETPCNSLDAHKHITHSSKRDLAGLFGLNFFGYVSFSCTQKPLELYFSLVPAAGECEERGREREREMGGRLGGEGKKRNRGGISTVFPFMLIE